MRNLRPGVAPGSGQLYAVGVRGAAQPSSPASSKLGGVLADLARHAALVRPDHALADLHALSPAARFARSRANGAPMVAIDAVTRGDPQALKAALLSLGLEHPAVYQNDVGGWLPVNQLGAAAARGEVLSLRAAMPHKRAAQGPVATQGDYAQGSSVVRTDFPTLTGSGVTVGVLSDSFNCYAQYAAPGSGVPVSGNEGYAYNGFTADYASDVASGALPAGVNVLGEADCSNYLFPDSAGQPTGLPLSDEGRAMLQIVHSVAPGASLAFYTGDNSEADFANGIQALANAGARVIADDLGYYDEPFFQDGLIAQAIDTAGSQGVAYFSAAGNDQETPSYMNTTPSFATLSSSAPNAGEYLLNFDATGATTVTSLPVTIPALPPGDFVAVVVEWDQPYVTGSPDSGGAVSQIDLCLSGATGSDVLLNYGDTVASCSGPNAVGSDPYQVMLIANPAVGSNNTPSETINIQIGLVNGTMPPGRIIVDVEDDGQGSTINQFSPDGPTIQGHPGAAGAAAVGAAFYFDTPRCGTSPATLEAYSSAGGAPILFSTTGARLATQTVRQKPDFVGPDGVNNTFLGFTLASAGCSLSVERSAHHHDHRMPEQSELSELLRYIGRDSPCRRRRRADAAGEQHRHAGRDLQCSALDRAGDAGDHGRGLQHHSQLLFRLWIHSTERGSRGNSSGRAQVDAVGRVDCRRQLGDDQLVRDQCRELHGVGKLERHARRRRHANAEANGSGHRHLFVDVHRIRPALRRRARPS